MISAACAPKVGCLAPALSGLARLRLLCQQPVPQGRLLHSWSLVCIGQAVSWSVSCSVGWIEDINYLKEEDFRARIVRGICHQEVNGKHRGEETEVTDGTAIQKGCWCPEGSLFHCRPAVDDIWALWIFHTVCESKTCGAFHTMVQGFHGSAFIFTGFGMRMLFTEQKFGFLLSFSNRFRVAFSLTRRDIPICCLFHYCEQCSKNNAWKSTQYNPTPITTITKR